jgi:adenylate kinase family enzyme
MKKTNPVLEFYSSRKNFFEIDGSSEIEVISSKIEQILRV